VRGTGLHRDRALQSEPREFIRQGKTTHAEQYGKTIPDIQLAKSEVESTSGLEENTKSHPEGNSQDVKGTQPPVELVAHSKDPGHPVSGAIRQKGKK